MSILLMAVDQPKLACYKHVPALLVHMEYNLGMKKDAEILPLLKGLMKHEVSGNPISGVRWTRKSTRALAHEMGRQGHGISRGTVGRLLRGMGFSLRANVKSLSGPRHPDRETQFTEIGKKLKSPEGKGAPILSVDAKKTEIIANYANAGKCWEKAAIKVDDNGSCVA